MHGRQPQCVDLSPEFFRCAWLAILVLHVLCATYFLSIAQIYRVVPGSYLDACLDFYSIGIKNTYYGHVATVYTAIGAAHVLLGALMVVWSLWRRSWSFGPLQTSVAVAVAVVPGSGTASTSGSPPLVRRVYNAFYARDGFFGVESPYFEAILIFRELLETALQTYQAYRMRQFVPRVWLNRFYVALLVLNCWSMPIIQLCFKTNAMRRRVLYLLSDTLLDLVSSVVIPVTLLLSYVRDYEPSFGGFDVYFWYDDVWLVNVLNEFQLILVASWSDLFSRVLFSLGLLGCMESIKDLIRPRPSSQLVLPQGPAVQDLLAVLSPPPPSVIHPRQLEKNVSIRAPALAPSHHLSFARVRTSASTIGHRCKLFIKSCTSLWGLLVLVLHFSAESKATVAQCRMQVRPWFGRKPACALLVVDCHREQIPGDAEQIAAFWEAPDESMVTRVVLRHCTSLQMPTRLQSFDWLLGLKVYNSTIVEWSEDAALTNARHPRISSLLLVRIVTLDGLPPLGIMAPDFPQLLYDIEICGSNIHTLPDALATTWPVGAYIYLERSAFDQYPSVLSILAPTQLSLGGNRLTTFTFEAVGVSGIEYLSLSENPITTLSKAPYEEIADAGTIQYLYLVDVNVSSLPRWLDPLLERRYAIKRAPIKLTNSPFCRYADEMKRGERAVFPDTALLPPDELSFVMAMTRETLDLKFRVDCTFEDALFYPLSHEDAWGAQSFSD
ncbi:hypothetical protein P43SY_009738 [Pythium insidiosum]|uniref:Uncharacterized protein n=1 Tax=Pythium insidiosum TaxID=114742 RepID=A0AAD5Q1M0_PYTIN|nr:hypothetical protein P43SY_009738 [Pythium insidiosum]